MEGMCILLHLGLHALLLKNIEQHAVILFTCC